MITKFPGYLQTDQIINPRLALDPISDELIAKFERRQREWAQIGRELREWLAAHPAAEVDPPHT